MNWLDPQHPASPSVLVMVTLMIRYRRNKARAGNCIEYCDSRWWIGLSIQSIQWNLYACSMNCSRWRRWMTRNQWINGLSLFNLFYLEFDFHTTFSAIIGHCRRGTFWYHTRGISLFVPPWDKITFICNWVGVYRQNWSRTALEMLPDLQAWINKLSINLCFSALSEDNRMHTFIIVP